MPTAFNDKTFLIPISKRVAAFKPFFLSIKSKAKRQFNITFNYTERHFTDNFVQNGNNI